jgi:hypothetical protein
MLMGNLKSKGDIVMKENEKDYGLNVLLILSLVLTIINFF